MPAFMFEKISSLSRGPSPTPIKEPRGVIIQMLDRLTESRLQREARLLRRVQREQGYAEADVSPQRTRGD